MSDNDSDGMGSASKAFSSLGSLTGSAGLMATGLATDAARGGSRWVGQLARRAGGLALKAGLKVSGLSGGFLGAGAGAGVAVGGIGIIMSLVMSLFGASMGIQIERRTGLDEVCNVLSQGDKDKTPDDSSGKVGMGTDTTGKQDDMARKVYAVFSYMGMNDQNIAGILGNWSQESGVDPTSVQNIYDEKYEIGPRKQAKLAGGGFATNSTGLGLGQWTGGRAQNLLDFAAEKHKDWYDVELQLAFMVSDKEGSDAEVVRGMAKNTNSGSDDPGAAAIYFLNSWERAGVPATENRTNAAGQWYAKMASWKGNVDTSLGSSVLALAGTSKAAADTNDEDVARAANDALQCPTDANGDDTSSAGGGNASAAVAFVTYAWPFYAKAAGNDGTDLYKYLHDKMYPGDNYYASCDRSVGTAVRWSGTDDTFPAGPVTAQLAYVNGEGASKWEHVGTFPSQVTEADLKPGDVMIEPGGNHIRMYVGKEAVKKVWPKDSDHEPNALYAQGSLNDHSPGLQGPGDSGPYEIYRNKHKEENSKFTKVKAPSDMPPGKGDEHAPLTTP